MSTINAWRIDAEGRFLEMLVGAIKDYGLDAVDWLNFGDAVNAVGIVWTLPTGLTLVDSSLGGTVVTAVIRADTAGEYVCSVAIPTAAALKEIVPFRVVVS